MECFLVCWGILRIEHDLNQTGRVAQIDEDHSSVIPPAIHPAGKHHLDPGVVTA